MSNTTEELTREVFANTAGDGKARPSLFIDGRRMRLSDWIVVAIFLKAEQGESPWVATKRELVRLSGCSQSSVSNALRFRIGRDEVSRTVRDSAACGRLPNGYSLTKKGMRLAQALVSITERG